MKQLTVNGRPTLEHVDLELLDSYRFQDGAGFPKSYRAFIRHAGWARLFGLWLIYPPVLPGFADGLQGRGKNLTAHFHAVYREGQQEEFDWMVEPDAAWSRPMSLRVFGWSENGDALLWDTASRTPDGEFAVWESCSLNSLHLLGGSLSEALPLIRARARTLFDAQGYDIEPLPSFRL
ncbi:hypothetical protein MUN78_02935 [Leucobacter allii]|uniref:Uncharacterized protein n=1 Tax=Leucobacter allii TaxID=2932247 RepID=A0ABY4FNE7_9MICO|nr:hypothetical protein [Leucobacter allii]UOQ57808.1 hypothetical protein MUN78_02935 [Leucobacter allii]